MAAHLSKKEIAALLDLLKEHKALGTLEHKTPEERVKLFVELAGRQLLVALHEATLGKPFVEIVADEYRRVTPDKARFIYLTVCLLNQFAVPVRAGIVARRHGVPFERFKEEFLGPLEQVISAEMDRVSKDYCYVARHPHIAQLVVDSVLSNKEDLFNEIVQTVQYLNPTYAPDRVAFRKLLSGRTILQTFPDHQMASRLFSTAKATVGDDPFVIQQQAIYEMNRPNGNLTLADSLLTKAHDLARENRSIIHTQAELYLRKASVATQRVEREKHLASATTICQSLKHRKDDHLPFYPLIKIGIMKIEDAQAQPDAHDTTIEQLTRETEKLLEEAKQRFPYSASVHSVEAELYECTSKATKALAAMRKSFDLNPRNSFIALRLAQNAERSGNLPEAIAILTKAIEAKPNDQRLRYTITRMMYDHRNGTANEILYHLERSYAPNDTNYGAQFLHACQLFAVGQHDKSGQLFRKLQRAGLAMERRFDIRFQLPALYTGSIQRMEASYCMISRDGDSATIFCSRSFFTDSEWDSISIGTRLSFRVGFNIKGPTAAAPPTPSVTGTSSPGRCPRKWGSTWSATPSCSPN